MNNDNNKDNSIKTVADLTRMALENGQRALRGEPEVLEDSPVESEPSDTTEQNAEINNKEQKKFKIKLKPKYVLFVIIPVIIVGVIVLVFNYVLSRNLNLSKYGISKYLKSDNLDTLIDNGVVFFSIKDNGINIMRFNKKEDKYVVEVLRNKLEIVGDYNNKLTCVNLVSPLYMGDASFVGSDYYSFKIAYNNNKFVFSSDNDEDKKVLGSLLGDYAALKSEDISIVLPYFDNSKYSGIYYPKDKREGNIVVLYNKDTNKYYIKGEIKKERKGSQVIGVVEADKKEFVLDRSSIKMKFTFGGLKIMSAINDLQTGVLKGDYKRNKKKTIKEIISDTYVYCDVYDEGLEVVD